MTRRERVLAHLAEHPGLTVPEISRILGGQNGGQVARLITDMYRKGQIVPAKVRRGHRLVNEWHVAPPGTKPVPIPDPDREGKRERDRRNKRRARALARGEDPGLAAIRQPWRRLHLPVGAFDRGNWRLPAECRTANPDLFFSDEAADIMQAQKICGQCPVWAECARAAEANAEQFGVWAGVDRSARHAEQVAS